MSKLHSQHVCLTKQNRTEPHSQQGQATKEKVSTLLSPPLEHTEWTMQNGPCTRNCQSTNLEHVLQHVWGCFLKELNHEVFACKGRHGALGRFP